MGVHSGAGGVGCVFCPMEGVAADTSEDVCLCVGTSTARAGCCWAQPLALLFGLVLGNLRPNRLVSEMSRVGGQPSGMGTHFTDDVSFALFAHFLNLPVLDATSGNVLCGV